MPLAALVEYCNTCNRNFSLSGTQVVSRIHTRTTISFDPPVRFSQVRIVSIPTPQDASNGPGPMSPSPILMEIAPFASPHICFQRSQVFMARSTVSFDLQVGLSHVKALSLPSPQELYARTIAAAPSPFPVEIRPPTYRFRRQPSSESVNAQAPTV